MKKIWIALLAIMIVLSLSACGKAKPEETPTEDGQVSTEAEERNVPPRERPDTEITLNEGKIKVTSKEVEVNEKKEAPFVYDEPVLEGTWQEVMGDQEFYSENAIGAVNIPSLNIRLAILNGMNDKIMHAGAGLWSPLQVMGQNNYPLIAHKIYLRADENILFNHLQDIEMGKIIRVTDLETIYEYKAYDMAKIGEDQLDAIDPFRLTKDGKAMVSLVTCVSLNEMDSRYVIYGELVGSKPYTEADFDAAE